jgi:hypothetical protein
MIVGIKSCSKDRFLVAKVKFTVPIFIAKSTRV